MADPVRVLCVFSTLDRGGAESMCMNLYRHIDREKVQFDFLLRDNTRTHYWDEIEGMGGRIFTTPPYPKKAFSNYIVTKKQLIENNPTTR